MWYLLGPQKTRQRKVYKVSKFHIMGFQLLSVEETCGYNCCVLPPVVYHCDEFAEYQSYVLPNPPPKTRLRPSDVM